MGLTYSSDDSGKLIRALSKNLASGKEAITQLKAGSQIIIQAIDGHTLSGAAYTAGKGLFTDLILPTIEKVTVACDRIEEEAQKYQVADRIVASEGFLDEDNLTQQLEIKKGMKASIDNAANVMSVLPNTYSVQDLLDTAQSRKRELNQMSETLQQDIEELQKKN
ncbi:LXG domain-containing protein [Listeria sp. ILCC792]|uniref:LXG domain-containing protein n=1 Tax=Listeria sp. ILCC792 TaxID=1918331 RepID=UPI001C6FCBBE|nr:LXG domain-containing protein [Listeria sp. ILCC792]